MKGCREKRETVFYGAVREGLSVEVTCEQNPIEMRQAETMETMWRNGIPGSGDGRFKGPVVAGGWPSDKSEDQSHMGRAVKNLADSGENLTFMAHPQNCTVGPFVHTLVTQRNKEPGSGPHQTQLFQKHSSAHNRDPQVKLKDR